MKVGYLGPDGSFTHTATKAAFPREELIALRSISLCIKAVQKEELYIAVVPVENTIEGTVNLTIDYLFHQSQMSVQEEIVLPISQQLMVHPKDAHDLSQIRQVLSHQQALAQCQQYLEEHFPLAELKEMSSTSFAAEFVSHHSSEGLAAIAPKLSADTYQLTIVEEDIQDIPLNKTRFWVLSRKKCALPLPKTAEKMSFALVMPDNMPGALYKALAAFAWRQINLSKIESRPLKTKLGEYFFLIDIFIEQPLQLIENAFEEIRLLGGEVKIFGQYSVYEMGKK